MPNAVSLRPDAELEAAKQADAMIERGDSEALAVWKRILQTVDELMRDKLEDALTMLIDA